MQSNYAPFCEIGNLITSYGVDFSHLKHKILTVSFIDNYLQITREKNSTYLYITRKGLISSVV